MKTPDDLSYLIKEKDPQKRDAEINGLTEQEVKALLKSLLRVMNGEHKVSL